jgi:hypothetical protein
MSDTDKQLAFLHEVESDVVEESKGLFGAPGEFREVAFTQILSEEMEAAGVLESPVVCRFESGRSASAIKCNGYSIPEEDSRLDLFVTLYEPGPHAELPALNAADVDVAFNKLERFLGKALSVDGFSQELDVSTPEWHMAQRIQDLAGDFDRVNFHLLTNSRLAMRRPKERKQTVQKMPAYYEIWDIERFRRLRESGAGYESVDVDLRSQPHGGLACVLLEQPEKDWRTCVAIFPGAMLANLYDEHGSRLLELNVRSYLQARGKVNKGILETLREKPSDFMAYNNGITIVAEDLEFGYLDNDVYGIVELKGMQIVNGGQTTASMHRALKEFEADLSNVFVQAKIVVVSSGRFNEVVPLISRFANSQNKVTEPDLAANHPFHVGIERVAQREWTPDQGSKWFYERSRGSYQTTRSREGRTSARKADFDKRFPKTQCFDKEDLARFECCWLGNASQVNKGRQKCFTFFMTLLKNERPDFPEGWEPDISEFKGYVAKAILYRRVQAIVRQNEEITAYRINVANFVAALIAEQSARRIDLEKIWQMQDISPALASVAAEWAPVVFKELVSFSAKQSVHVDNVLKGEDLWEHIKSLDLQLGAAAEKDLVSFVPPARQQSSVQETPAKKTGKRSKDEKLTQQDQNNIAFCMELPARHWLELVQWGRQGNLEDWVCNIASTLAGQAANGWDKPPSKRQAKYLVDAIKLARKAGLFS